MTPLRGWLEEEWIICLEAGAYEISSDCRTSS